MTDIESIEAKSGRQQLKLGKTQVELPPGVTLADWALERTRLHNPRIRSYLGCIRITEKALDSNYAILHCSPARLAEIWRLVRSVAVLIRDELAPTLKEDSVFPQLDAAIANAESAYQELSANVIREILRYPEQLTAAHSPAVRKLLCVATGKIYAFLRDTLGEILASDPRSQRDADYFLSKSFAKDIEESEWLYSSVYALREYVDGLQIICSSEFKDFMTSMRTERMIPHAEAWQRMARHVHTLLTGLTPKLKEVLALRGIRVNEIEPLDKCTFEIPYQCRALIELHEAGRLMIDRIKSMAGTTFQEREQSVKDLISCHEIISARMTALISGIDTTLRNLAAFLPRWLAAIEKRRCLMLTKSYNEIPREPRGAAPLFERRKEGPDLPARRQPRMTLPDGPTGDPHC